MSSLKRKFPVRTIGLLLGLVLTGCGPEVAESDTGHGTTQAAVTHAPASGILFGAFAGKRGAEDTAAALDALERLAGRKMDVHRIYATWDEAQPNKFVSADLARGRIPLLSIEAKLQGGADSVAWSRHSGSAGVPRSHWSLGRPPPPQHVPAEVKLRYRCMTEPRSPPPLPSPPKQLLKIRDLTVGLRAASAIASLRSTSCVFAAGVASRTQLGV